MPHHFAASSGSSSSSSCRPTHHIRHDASSKKKHIGNHQHGSMYSAFLMREAADLHSPLLFTGIKYDGDNGQEDDEESGPAGDREADVVPAAVVNSTEGKDGASSSNGKKFTLLRRTNIHILNIVAAIVHGILFLVLYFLALGRENRQAWALKQDRTQTLPHMLGMKSPFVQVSDPTCSNPAKPNMLNFTNSSMGPLQTWTFPQVMNMLTM